MWYYQVIMLDKVYSELRYSNLHNSDFFPAQLSHISSPLPQADKWEHGAANHQRTSLTERSDRSDKWAGWVIHDGRWPVRYGAESSRDGGKLSACCHSPSRAAHPDKVAVHFYSCKTWNKRGTAVVEWVSEKPNWRTRKETTSKAVKEM